MEVIVNIGVTIGIVTVIAFVCYFIYAGSKANEESLKKQKKLDEENYSREEQRILEGVEIHRVALKRNLDRALKINDYGAIVKDNRVKVIVEFFNSIGLDTDIINLNPAIDIAIDHLNICIAKDQELANAPPSKERHAIEKQKIIEETNLHYSTLMRNIDRAAMKNEYGTKVEDKREKVLINFFKSIGLEVQVIDYPEAGEICVAELNARMKIEKNKGFDISTIPTDGHEFEHWVAENLNKFGWDAKATSGSGDQGIDVIATKDGKTVGLQCKLLKSSVGNKAVQEAHAGKAFHQMDVVGVITNASYTKSAKALAADTGVKLLSHRDIPNLYDKMFYE